MVQGRGGCGARQPVVRGARLAVWSRRSPGPMLVALDSEEAAVVTMVPRRAAWVPVELPGLGRGANEYTPRSGRGRTRPYGTKPHRGRLRPQ